MENKNFIFLICFVHMFYIAGSQTALYVYPDSLITNVNNNFTPGCFFGPKTAPAYNDFLNNGIHQNVIRTNAIESALNNSTNLSGCLSLLSTYQADLVTLSAKCSKFIFIFEKMPLWLSSSTDGSPAAIPGYYVFNTKPPANWNLWQTAVDSISSKIINQFGISNAVFEIWNEPDMGSWTGTMTEYFELYKRTYDGIKSASNTAIIGGPSVNFWGNNIYWEPPYGYISNQVADSSLIGQLLDSALIWNKIPDFISFHLFNINHQSFFNACNYIQQKCNSLSIPQPKIIISEWNAPSAVRDKPLATSYMLKAQMEMAKTAIDNNSIAAWQDFNSSTIEFHNDYGLLTYGAIRKPAYNSILLSEKLNGTSCKIFSTAPFDGIASVSNDTLFILVSNYCPPVITEAINHTLYIGQYTINQLDSAGYVDIANKSLSPLDSIYAGFTSLPGTDNLQIAINNSIPVFQHFDSIYSIPRQFQITLGGYSGNYAAQHYVVDSTQNNMQFIYDSLRASGYTQLSAIAAILPNQNVISTSIPINSGLYSFSLKPNAVCLFKINIPEVSAVTENNTKDYVKVYPNPTDGLTNISNIEDNFEIIIYNPSGQIIHRSMNKKQINLNNIDDGIYFVKVITKNQVISKKILKVQ